MRPAETMLHRRLMRQEEPEWIVWLLVVVLLIAGTVVQNRIEGKLKEIQNDVLSFSYPARWGIEIEESSLVKVTEPFSLTSLRVGVTADPSTGYAVAVMTTVGLSYR